MWKCTKTLLSTGSLSTFNGLWLKFNYEHYIVKKMCWYKITDCKFYCCDGTLISVKFLLIAESGSAVVLKNHKDFSFKFCFLRQHFWFKVLLWLGEFSLKPSCVERLVFQILIVGDFSKPAEFHSYLYSSLYLSASQFCHVRETTLIFMGFLQQALIALSQIYPKISVMCESP